MITAEEILALQTREPFQPFRIYLTDGRKFDVEHPEQLLVFRNTIYLALRPEGKIPERAERIAILHITSHEAVEA